MKDKYRGKIVLLFCGLLFGIGARAQVTVTGPACVTGNTVYQYNLTAAWDSASTLQVCVTGGRLADSASGCYSGSPLPFVRIIWDSAGSEGSVAIVSSSGNTSLAVEYTPLLDGGIIDTALVMQILDSATVPATIGCSVATGGSCDASYQYQWQQSSDGVNWSDIGAATNQQLVFSSTFSTAVFFRRKVTENTSHTIGYSNQANIFIMISTGGSN